MAAGPRRAPRDRPPRQGAVTPMADRAPQTQSLPPLTAESREAGFTLVELLASLSILAVLLGLVALGLDIIGRGWDRAALIVSDRDMIARGFDAIRGDLARVQRPVALVGQRPLFLFDGGESEVRFVAIEPAYPTEPGPHLIQLAVRRTGDVTRLVRARLPWHPKLTLNPAAPFREEVVVLEGTFDLRFGYLDAAGGGAGRWLDRWPHQDRMPRLMRLEVLSRADRSALVPPMVVALVVDAEHGCTGAGQEPCSPRTGGVLRQGEPQRPPGSPQGDGRPPQTGTPPPREGDQ